jgi:hypothetical protein
MAVYHPHAVRCACGAGFEVYLARSLNVRRTPEARCELLAGRLHRARCPQCARTMTLERRLLYLDPGRASVALALPRGERHRFREASGALDAASALLPASFGARRRRRLRVCFGLDELREKLLAEDAALDDRDVEMLKAIALHEHPSLLRTPRLRLALDRADAEALELVASYEHDPRRFRLSLPRAAAEALRRRGALARWARRAHGRRSIYDAADHWVSFWRWSPQPSALERLREVADAVRAGGELDVASPGFRSMLAGLPRGSHLPDFAKRDLRTLFEYAKRRRLAELEDALFEIRFGIGLEDDWGRNADLDDVDTLWRLLRDLPDSNVEGNVAIREILLEEGERGGWYDPRTHDVAIGEAELPPGERFERVVRHELGHAVHEQQGAAVTRWLASRFGWRAYAPDDAGIDAWVERMGGWRDLSARHRADVRRYLREALGPGGRWAPGPAPAAPAGHPWRRRGFGPRLAYERTGATWWQGFARWHRARGIAFFLNYWYRAPMAVDVATLELVAKMPDSYASMSHLEFFAELYALFHDVDDPRRGAIPADVAAWLTDRVGAPEVGAPARGRKRRR